jgi:hypothetical protein
MQLTGQSINDVKNATMVNTQAIGLILSDTSHPSVTEDKRQTKSMIL